MDILDRSISAEVVPGQVGGVAPDLRHGGNEMVNHFPFGQDFVVLRDAMNQLLEESFVPARGTRASNGTATARPLPLDVYTRQDEAIVIAAVPGMSPQDLEVTVNHSVVTLSGT